MEQELLHRLYGSDGRDAAEETPFSEDKKGGRRG
jgi:hypothetical protein